MWIIVLVLIVLLSYFYFNRDPNRVITRKGRILSPADGKILEVSNVKKTVKFKKGFGYTRFASDMKLPATMVRIFLRILDVHVQRSPVEGVVQKVKHVKGKRLPAFQANAWKNEHVEILIKSKKGNVKIVLVAGVMASRIKPSVKKGQKVQKGERIARILLGSQVCVLFKQCQVKIKRGDRVKAGTTIIA